MTTATVTPPVRTRGPVLNSTLIVVCQSMQALAFGGIALFLPIIRQDVAITTSQAGLLAAIGTATYALMQIPSGYLSDRFDPKRLFVFGLLGTNLLSLTFALLDSYGWLLANQAVSGIFRSLVFAPGLLLISRQFREDRRATAMGLYVAGGFSSNILLNALGPVLVGPLGWRWLMILFSVSGVLVLLAFAKLGDSAPHKADAKPPTWADAREILAHRAVWLSGFVQFVRLAVVTGMAFWLPSLLVEDKGFSLGMAGAVVAIGATVTAPSNFLGGWVADRLGRPLAVVGISLAMLAVTIFLIPFVDALPALIAVIAVNSIFLQLYFGPLFAVPLRYVGTANTGLVSGFGNFCANLGGVAFSYGLGAFKDATGSFDAGLWTLAGLCVAGLVATWLISRLPTDDLPAERTRQ
ncbi:nitrate/nitrite transporter NarK [Nonomuraea thailandensis]|uniref:Nitrate/nitrite transporter NarK n=1 Tax=Nonomuraea thailandensis TaxID=1188745 RepID=A0A9X2GQT4_9ACTN|nr:MFS transporter [Nonomuraea thailandensis]MCP2360001.1 nitrate/nitrite transporter NarK [Nonomuraea thailandensis]